MDLLRTAVVDITTLVATFHAMTASPAEGDMALQRRLRGRLRRDIKRGTVAYIDALARTGATRSIPHCSPSAAWPQSSR